MMISKTPEVISVDSNYRFSSPEDWLDNYFRCRELGFDAPLPKTREELLLAQRVGLLRPEWIPCQQGLELLDLPSWFGQTPEPWDEQEVHRFIATFMGDVELVSVVCDRLLEVRNATR